MFLCLQALQEPAKAIYTLLCSIVDLHRSFRDLIRTIQMGEFIQTSLESLMRVCPYQNPAPPFLTLLPLFTQHCKAIIFFASQQYLN